jgi:glycosyltransferase involved in cell wall biosynthesis
MGHRGRILHLIDTGGPGGAETVFLELVRRLPEHGWDSIPIVPKVDWLSRSLSAAGFEPIKLAARRTMDLRYLRDLKGILRRERIDLVQTHLLGTSVYATLASAGAQIPVVSTFHGRPDIPSGGRFRQPKSRLLHHNQIVCVSRSLRQHFLSRGDLGEQTIVIPNGIDLLSFTPGRGTTLRKELGLAASVPLVGAVGNVRPSKAYPSLLEAFAILRKAVPDAHLVIAGQQSGALYDDLLSLRSSLGIEDCAHFLGFRADVAQVLSALDVFALSSSSEGFSLATVQAMAMGLPVVATRSGGPEEIVGDSSSALLVEPRDPVELSSAIVRLLSDRRLARELGAAARKHVMERYSVERMAERYSALYERLLHRRR